MKKDSEEFALVFEDGDPMRVRVVVSLLEDAGIDCMVKNDGVQNLFALGSLGGMNPLIGVMKILVRHEDREAAEKLLCEAGPGPLPPEAFPCEDEAPQAESSGEGRSGFLTRLRKWVMG